LSDGLILAPFSSSPQSILEAARAGFRILVPAHNPILRFLIENLAKPVPKDILKTALVHLASSSKAGQRIKPLILSLYETDCPHCGAPTPASAFIWSRDNHEPISKVCRCRTCGEESSGDVNAADINKANEYQENSPSHARALTRVSAPDDPIRLQVEIALRSYPPRSVYALFTLFNKISAINPSSDEKRALEMLLLYAFYRSSSPETRLKAERSADPDQDDLYQEENVWFTMEEALDIWESEDTDISIHYWPDIPPPSGGICIYPGRIRELIPLITGLPISAVLLTFPQPRFSFWALSALWTGWLWGQDAAAPLRSILSVRNYDWSWMTRAVGMTIAELREQIPREIPYLGCLPELSTDYLLASLSAASLAGLELENLSIESDLKYAMTSWYPEKPSANLDPQKNDREIIREAGFEMLKKYGEPQHIFKLYGAGLVDLIKKGSLQKTETAKDIEIDMPALIKDFEENIAYRQGFLHYSKIENWWHQDLSLSPEPLSAKIERNLVNLLVNNTDSLPENVIFQKIYQSFPSLSTPRESYIRVLLESYGDRTSHDPPKWKLKANDQPTKRKNDLKEMEISLTRLGQELGFSVVTESPVGNIIHLGWSTEIATHHNFFISASGMLNRIITRYAPPLTNAWIVLPGSRAGLIYYKLQHNPIMDEIIKNHFGLVKFRHLRRLEEQGGLTHTNIQERFALDPFTSESPQLPLI